MESKCKILYCTHCWLQREVTRSLYLQNWWLRGIFTSPVGASPVALNTDVHIFSLRMMFGNDVLFQVGHEWVCCLVWQPGAVLSQTSVGGVVLAVATVEGCFLLHRTVSSVTGQSEAFSRGCVAVKLRVHCGRCTGSMPLLIPTDWSARLFFFPLEWKSKLGHFWFPVLSRPPDTLTGTLGPASFMEKCWPGEMGLFTSWCCLRRWLSGMSTFQKLLSRERHV